MTRHTQALLLLFAFAMPGLALAKPRYQGTPFHDSVYNGGAQHIPGKVMCAYYDLGGEGVAYHDADAKNNGSGGLNPADGNYLNQFRMNEGVDTSYTKFRDAIDNNPFNLVEPPPNMLYVGWVEPGEWFNITVQVEKTGTYTVDFFYTSKGGADISFDLNGKKLTGPLTVTSTYNAADPIDWRQMHHWGLMKNLAQIKLHKGVRVLTVHTLTKGHVNYAYFDFELKAK